ncbi:hypothetical protein niasHS_009875 [Heterodera schachtii]|uniref:Uncharacterized protein n=2 Tax=Heterodera TaxID=34509 RepID=A0ABD2JCS1_HETSC
MPALSSHFVIDGTLIGTLAFLSTLPTFDCAVMHSKAEMHSKYSLTVPGKYIVKRQTAASSHPQYLFPGQTGFTTNGKDRIGDAHLDFATGVMIIDHLNDNDFGSYSFPLEHQPVTVVNGHAQSAGESVVELVKK